MADAMYAPVVTRFLTYDVTARSECAAYCHTIMAMPLMLEWIAARQSRARRIGRARRRVLTRIRCHSRGCLDMALDLLLRQGRQAEDNETPVDIAIAGGRIVEIAQQIIAEAPAEDVDGRLVIARLRR